MLLTFKHLSLPLPRLDAKLHLLVHSSTLTSIYLSLMSTTEPPFSPCHLNLPGPYSRVPTSTCSFISKCRYLSIGHWPPSSPDLFFTTDSHSGSSLLLPCCHNRSCRLIAREGFWNSLYLLLILYVRAALSCIRQRHLWDFLYCEGSSIDTAEVTAPGYTLSLHLLSTSSLKE